MFFNTFHKHYFYSSCKRNKDTDISASNNIFRQIYCSLLVRIKKNFFSMKVYLCQGGCLCLHVYLNRIFMFTCFTRIECFFLSSMNVLYGHFLCKKERFIRKSRFRGRNKKKKFNVDLTVSKRIFFEEKYQCTYPHLVLSSTSLQDVYAI